MKKEQTLREPFVRMVKRDAMPGWQRACIYALALLLALIVCSAVIVAFTGLNPVTVFKTMFETTFGTPDLAWKNRAMSIWTTVRDTMILLCVALALVPAFRMRFWNIGGEGQILVGGLATAFAMRQFGDAMPTWLLFTYMVCFSLLAGMVWGLLPAVFKAFWNTNETLFTLMMNYIAIQIVSAFSILWEAKQGSGSIGVINKATKAGHMTTSWLSGAFGTKNYIIDVMIVLALTILIFVYMKYTKHGYELTVVGESGNTARYAGINVRRVIIRTMALSGALCGLAGFILVSGSSHTISTNTAGGRGFTAIIVAWLAKFNPFMMIVISFFLVFMDYGAKGVATSCGLNKAFSDIITGIILFFILGSEFFINYRLVFRGGRKEAL
ncbi:MAG: ABC transporter permease [Clostridiales bacterium]|nr:ABC transporter permease [Clostridiales bacterium]MDY2834020.1 ABC transporter permease [Candidatus Aphodomonas sp.]